MDFHLDEDLTAVRDLAREILTDRATPDRAREVERSGTRTDARLWTDLARAGLLGIGLPEKHDGAGLGLAGLVVVLVEQGRRVAPVPLWSAGVAAAAVAEHGSDDQRGRLLPGLADGSARLTLALEEYAGEPDAPECAARPDGAGWTLHGVKAVVPTPTGVDGVLVSAATPDGTGLFLVDPAAPGVAWQTSAVTTHDLAGELRLDGAVAERVGGPESLAPVLATAAVAVAAVQLGVARGAIEIAAAYVSAREQFGRPLGTFQALQHQLADCWIDAEAMEVTLWQAVSDLADGSPAAPRSALVAKWWCGQAGLDVVHRVQHVHGGIGVDVDYPVHRYFLWGKQLSSTLGGAGAALADLGDLLAVTEVRS
ncbi:acyl-CoA dehydrogenase family protein [Nocardioides sp. YIM 152315]|uniref:acyl-CoA dehydrogenase family protein n=1 Tax=Nocardioides sp. YIM 152315 TaxID=3031760 RepID=UPI0023DA5F40|nr:acyl-CoA dehydrogenase family protein [Nocardioides sp. YIM 152315]MDF1604724.1 acyl-CoA/acyl-ACP dehydrogenase [Nocardioides sp. YIM 152315]